MKETPCENRPNKVNIEISYGEYFDIMVALNGVPEETDLLKPRLGQIPRRNIEMTSKVLDELEGDDQRQLRYGTIDKRIAKYIWHLYALSDASRATSTLHIQALNHNANAWNKLFA